MVMKSVIQANNLSKYYGNFKAVDDISFQVYEGEIYGFLGPNGAGKTTTINMLIGLSKISGGKIFYFGKDHTRKMRKAQNIIGVVADESNLYDDMTGFDNLCFCGSLYGMKKSERQNRARELLDSFGLAKVADRKFKAYSKGMKRKLTIAASLIHNPEIIFLDEPTSGIDVMSLRQIREMIRSLNDKGTTIFLTTHYIEEAERLCDRVAFINNGKIIKSDSVSKMIEDSKDFNVIDISFERITIDKEEFINSLKAKFPGIECSFKNHNTISVITQQAIDITPIVNFFSTKKIFVFEARLSKPSLEDAFMKFTNIDMAKMLNEKEKK